MKINVLSLALASLRRQALANLLTLMLLALGVATIVLLLLAGVQLEERLVRDTRGIDLVVGAKGSPLQLVLSAVHHVDVPTGNIPLREAQALARHPMVDAAYPMALGDAFAGFRIVGTSHAYVAHYGAELVAGALWKEPLEAVLGAGVAARTGLSLGDRFVGSHGVRGAGHDHEDAPYTVVGVLAPSGTVLDRLVLTGVESVWRVHEQPAAGAEGGYRPSEEITALLIRYRSPIAAVTFPRMVNSRSALQAASPAFETARLLGLVGVGVDVLRAFAAVLIVSAGLSLFIALYGALEEQQFDLAVMRTLGASRPRILWHVLVQALLLGGSGVLLGLALGHSATEALGAWLSRSRPIPLTGAAWAPGEAWLASAALGVAVLAAAVPALRAYRLDIARVLAER